MMWSHKPDESGSIPGSHRGVRTLSPEGNSLTSIRPMAGMLISMHAHHTLISMHAHHTNNESNNNNYNNNNNNSVKTILIETLSHSNLGTECLRVLHIK